MNGFTFFFIVPLIGAPRRGVKKSVVKGSPSFHCESQSSRPEVRKVLLTLLRPGLIYARLRADLRPGFTPSAQRKRSLQFPFILPCFSFLSWPGMQGLKHTPAEANESWSVSSLVGKRRKHKPATPATHRTVDDFIPEGSPRFCPQKRGEPSGMKTSTVRWGRALPVCLRLFWRGLREAADARLLC